MRLAYKDALDELHHLIELSRKNPRISHISVTKNELRGILKHGNVDKVLPRFTKTRNNLLKTVNAKMDYVRNELSEKEITDEKKFELFATMDELEKQQMEIEEKVPTQIVEDGYTIKVSLK